MPSKSHNHFHHLKKKLLHRHVRHYKKMVKKHQDVFDWLHNSSIQILAGSIAGLLLLGHPAVAAINDLQSEQQKEPVEQKPAHTVEGLIAELKQRLPGQVQPLSTEEEKNIEAVLTEYFQVPVRAELEGKRLNRSYGLIGAEQHLMRYPGDTMDTHFSAAEELKYYSSGMAPGRGAWGYFAPSAEALTQKDIDREKYYLAVQTFLSPGWNENVNEMYTFFKYRKMLVVNPENGKAMVVVIGDAGPAEFTGKHLGGSPEVMSYLERQDGGAKGPVLYFFIDDPEDKIPLGPVSI